MLMILERPLNLSVINVDTFCRQQLLYRDHILFVCMGTGSPPGGHRFYWSKGPGSPGGPGRAPSIQHDPGPGALVL